MFVFSDICELLFAVYNLFNCTLEALKGIIVYMRVLNKICRPYKGGFQDDKRSGSSRKWYVQKQGVETWFYKKFHEMYLSFLLAKAVLIGFMVSVHCFWCNLCFFLCVRRSLKPQDTICSLDFIRGQNKERGELTPQRSHSGKCLLSLRDCSCSFVIERAKTFYPPNETASRANSAKKWQMHS